MSVLCVVSIIWLNCLYKLTPCQQIRSTNIDLCFIWIASIRINCNLFIIIPDLIDTMTIYSFANTQTIYIIFITCCCFAISKSNQLIQTIISICLCLICCDLCDLISIGIVRISSFFSLCICCGACNQICWTNC